MSGTRIRGLLFDKDGTLFDFALSWSGVIDSTLAMLTDDADLQQRMALSTGYDKAAGRFEPGSPAVAGAMDDVARTWAGFVPQYKPADILAIADRIATTAVADGALVPAVADLSGYLGDLRSQGFVLGIATHDSEEAARVQLTGFSALEHFDFVAGYDSGHGLKPGPGMLLAFARATGLRPGEIAMIGDSVHDLGVAPAAGAALAIGVLTGPADHTDLAPYADHVLPSIADLPALLQSLSPAG